MHSDLMAHTYILFDLYKFRNDHIHAEQPRPQIIDLIYDQTEVGGRLSPAFNFGNTAQQAGTNLQAALLGDAVQQQQDLDNFGGPGGFARARSPNATDWWDDSSDEEERRRKRIRRYRR